MMDTRPFMPLYSLYMPLYSLCILEIPFICLYIQSHPVIFLYSPFDMLLYVPSRIPSCSLSSAFKNTFNKLHTQSERPFKGLCNAFKCL